MIDSRRTKWSEEELLELLRKPAFPIVHLGAVIALASIRSGINAFSDSEPQPSPDELRQQAANKTGWQAVAAAHKRHAARPARLGGTTI